MPEPPLRVIDFGLVPPLRSQTLWHAVAYGVSAGAPPTLSFTRPVAAYACLGYHRDPGELDAAYCRAAGLSVYRRMVGGGPVYVDQRQFLFQICLPAGLVPGSRAAALRELLAPVVAAFRAVGVAAEFDSAGEICAAGRKICGHGAGQIEEAVVVCGNLIEAFDHQAATAILALPDQAHRAETLRLMRRYVAATPAADAGAFRSALTAACAAALGRSPVAGGLNAAERARLAALDAKFTSPGWLAGPAPKAAAQATARQVKVKAGVWTVAARAINGERLVASVVGGRIERAPRAPVGAGLPGLPLAEAAARLGALGPAGTELAAALAWAERRS